MFVAAVVVVVVVVAVVVVDVFVAGVAVAIAAVVVVAAVDDHLQKQGSANQPLINREIAIAVVNDSCCWLLIISLLIVCSSVDGSAEP